MIKKFFSRLEKALIWRKHTKNNSDISKIYYNFNDQPPDFPDI